MKITFCGANQEVTGSCYYIETERAKVVLDCGMFQGGKYAEDKNHVPFPFQPAQLDAMVLTHAHFDHTGRIPKMYKEGFRGRIWCTDPTAELSIITLRDAAHLMAEEAERHRHAPLYEESDVEPLQDLWEPIRYHEEKEVAPGVYATFSDAGHILGSASIKIRADGQEAVFSGDLGNTPVPLLRNLECVDSADIVIIESTYGNRVHEPASERLSVLRDAIRETVRKKGVLLIPAFAVERTQELLFELNELHTRKEIPTLPIFLDSPLGITATEVFRAHLDYFNAEAQKTVQHDPELFRFAGTTYTRTSQESKAILQVPGPKVIIAGSGMMNGGRILHHLKNYLGNQSTMLLIIGFQVEGSLGRRLHRKERDIQIFGEPIHVNATIVSCGAFSGHADYPRLIHWLNCFSQHPPRKVFVTHGELNSALAFSQSIEDTLGVASGVPSYGDTVDIARLGRPEAVLFSQAGRAGASASKA